MEIESAGEIRWLRSTLIDSKLFVHGFPERTGGVSLGPQASLNLRDRTGRDEENVLENRRVLGEAAGFNADKLVVTQHVHGTAVWDTSQAPLVPNEFDGMVTAEPGVVLGAFAADCLPVLFADSTQKVCGAAHSGWRGTVNKIGPNVIDSMVKAGAVKKDIAVAIGPSIGPCCFEVGEEVAAEFDKAFPGEKEIVNRDRKKPHVDIYLAMKAQLLAVNVENIDERPPCTKCEAKRFFSYRREGSPGGVHMGFIALRTS